MMEQVASGKRPPAQKKPSYLLQELGAAALEGFAMQTGVSEYALVEQSQSIDVKAILRLAADKHSRSLGTTAHDGSAAVGCLPEVLRQRTCSHSMAS